MTPSCARSDHDDTDVAVRLADLDAPRATLADWHLWEPSSGWLRPLQLWARRDAASPWQLDIVIDRSEDEWVFKKDARIRVPWPHALYAVDGVPHLRPEIALLHKAHLDRPKDRASLAAACLDAEARAWLIGALDLLGHQSWARLARR